MNIGYATIYGDVYAQDRLFDETSCKIGENLLKPGIALKDRMEKGGHSFHTIDLFSTRTLEYGIFQDLCYDYYITRNDPIAMAKYIYRQKWRDDHFLRARKLDPEKRLLIIQEPEVVSPLSYCKEYHKYFGKILTWNDDLVDNRKYFKFFYPQPVPARMLNKPFAEKRMLTMMCSNKTSEGANELYSARREVIRYYEEQCGTEFDLYGVGWEGETLKNYKGKAAAKLETLSGYRFAICYENMTNVKGYITEKIFDCFFAGCVPIYQGADNITDYIPKGTFIDRKVFQDMDELTDFLKRMDEEEYRQYTEQAQEYLHSELFRECFSVEAYVNRIYGLVTGQGSSR